MAFGLNTISFFGGAVNDLFSSSAKADEYNLKGAGLNISAQGTRISAEGIRLQGQAGRLRAQGDITEAQNYTTAAGLARQNSEFTAQSTKLQELTADRQIYQGIGTERAEVGGAGFQQSGSAVDLLRSSAQQGALQKEVISQQGLMTEAGYNEQATAYDNLASYGNFAASQETQMAGEQDKIANETDVLANRTDDLANQTRDLAGQTRTAGDISAGFKIASGIASFFL